MKKVLSLTACVLLMSVSIGLLSGTARAVDPAESTQIQLRAEQAFNRGEYNAALPLFKRLAESYKDEPSRLGPVEEKIRVCEKALAAAKNDPSASSTQPVNAIATSAESRKPHPVIKAGDVAEMSIKELGNFDFDQEKGGNIPKDVVAMSGSKVRLHGYMIPMDQAENITQFALVPSLFACCFGQPPQIQHTVVVTCPKGKAVAYCPDEIVVEGALKVQEKKDDGYIVSIFDMDVNSVRPAPK